ncbi:hypothetical protein APY94_00080 [Thermococcus celericrescens]|uniref:Nucleotidyltransferase n=1 Tax=Thermococcus celericrescens TaxID=227598 RepID=A0A100XZY6_9EURY|nr:hypothetical protein [Thermococcus celericrescens]KUH34810.1 hypothetical protein APY94_00080 [Thermococcus celericrescens]
MITRERLIEEFWLVDEKARLMGSGEIHLYLIGGGNLALRGLKPATADVDVVVESLSALSRLEGVLTDPSPELRTSKGLVIYIKVAEHEYQRKLGAYSVYKKLDPELGDFNLDVFVKRVLRGITLTKGVMERAFIPEEFKGLKRLKVHLVSPEDIFLFKGVTSLGRSKDIDDIMRLLEMGIDFDVVLEEVEAQKKVIESERFEYLMGLFLEKMRGVRAILKERGLRSSGLDKFINSLEELLSGSEVRGYGPDT